MYQNEDAIKTKWEWKWRGCSSRKWFFDDLSWKKKLWMKFGALMANGMVGWINLAKSGRQKHTTKNMIQFKHKNNIATVQLITKQKNGTH